MAKKILFKYTFDASENTVVFPDIYAQKRFLLITNVNTGDIIYSFNDPAAGFTSVAFDYDAVTTTVVLAYDTTAMSDTDNLQVFIEADEQTMRPSPTFTDPVSKLRVSNPENLIDTDFEYSLQSTRWETLELTANIPTFFNRNGDLDVEVNTILIQTGSNIVTVATVDPHGFQRGQPVLVSGSAITSCDGGFIVSSVPDANTFTYISKSTQASGGSIKTSYTQIFPGSIYSGTEFKLENVGGIVSDELTPSTLTVSTIYPTKFTNGTKLALSNSFATSDLNFNTDDVDPDNSITQTLNVTNSTPTGETSQSFALGSAQPHRITTSQPTRSVAVNSGGGASYFFDYDDVTVTGNQIDFGAAHNFVNGQATYYVPGYLNTPFGGLPEGARWIRVIDATTIELSLSNTLSGTIVLSGNGVSGQVCRGAFLYAIGFSSSTGGSSDYFNSYGANWAAALPGANGSAATRMVFSSSGSIDPVKITDFLNQAYDGSYDYYKNRTGSATQMSVSTNAGGARTNLSTNGTDGFVIPITDAADANSLFFPAHGLSTNQSVVFTNTNTAPTGLTSGTGYGIQVLSVDRIRLLNNGVIVNLNTGGSANAVFTLTSTSPSVTGDTIEIAGNNLSNEDAITYDVNGGTLIGGLTDGTVYYVARKTGDRFRLANALPIITSTLSFTNLAATSGASYVDVANDRLAYTSHGLITGDQVIFTANNPPYGIVSDTVYHARVFDANSFYLHYTAAEAASGTNTVVITGLGSGTGTLGKTSLVDITSTPSGETQIFTASFVGAADGNYEVASTSGDQLSFTVTAPSRVLGHVLVNISQNSFDSLNDAIYSPNHGFITGDEVTLALVGDTNVAGVTNGTYYIITVNLDYFQFATTYLNAIDEVFIALTETGAVAAAQDGTITLSSTSIVGEIASSGTVSITTGSALVTGDGTSFRSLLSSGDTIKISVPPTTVTTNITSVAANIITATAHGISTGLPVTINATTTFPAGLQDNRIYYARLIDANRFTLHFSRTDALANSNIITVTTAGTGANVTRTSNIGQTVQGVVDFVNGNSQLTLEEAVTVTSSSAEFFASTALVVRADGQTLHRPYDGGVELIVSSNPDSKMVRQTRRYFRYQSGKGIQVSFAVNFSPSTQIQLFSRAADVGTITTRVAHRLSVGLQVVVSDATNLSDSSIWNATMEVLSIVDDYTFTVQLSGTPADATATGLVQFYVEGWSGSSLACGLFDDQNGLYFQYDGSILYACRRSSTAQISGTVAVEFRSGSVSGTNTRFVSQLDVNDNIVIRGQTYRVTRIDGDELLYIAPSFMGVASDSSIVSKIITTRVAQADWSIDPCDGTGPSGFQLNHARIQMAYMDYSWYGAGKVRFGFKDQNGDVIYCHTFVHGNFEREAYMRSGNLPARYEIENIGTPSYVPALAHWGTSVIMDGGFDPDEAYLFNASSNNVSISGVSTLTVSARVETLLPYTQRINNRDRSLGYGLLLAVDNSTYNSINPGLTVTGAGISGAVSKLPNSTQAVPYQPYMPSITARINGSAGTQATRSLLLIDKPPTLIAGANSNYTVTLATSSSVTKIIPLISIRLSPSVDNGTPGFLGERDIINRMQLILDQVGIISTHTAEINLIFNGELSSNSWQRVNQPSLSQLIYHTSDDTIVGGSSVSSFRAQGGTGTTTRSAVLTTQDLKSVSYLGNSILGGNNTYPDGPDVLTIAATLQEDPSTVAVTNPFVISGRVSWSESQA
jgi:hypothetical protein